MKLEQAVRPFQSPTSVVSGRIVYSTQKQPLEQVRLRWGSAGTVPTAIEDTSTDEGGVSFTVNDCSRSLTETSRKTTDQPVVDSNNSANSVTVRRIDSITFREPEKEDPTFSYSGYAVDAAMKEFDANFSNGNTKKTCDSTFKLKWDQ